MSKLYHTLNNKTRENYQFAIKNIGKFGELRIAAKASRDRAPMLDMAVPQQGLEM